MIDVSIIVPVYNSAPFLAKCLDSLISQSIESLEIIIINDGSTDDSLKIINNYKAKKNKINLISTKNNGIGVARNIGLKQAKGKYITFVDSDDYISDNFVEEMLLKAKQTNADIVVCDMYKTFNHNLTKSDPIKFESGNLEHQPKQLLDIPLGPCGKLFSKKILKTAFAENLKYEDVPFVSNALLNSKNTVKLDKYMYYYTIHKDSETTSMDERVFDILKILEMTNFNLKKYPFLNNEIEYLNILLLSRYNLQQRNQKEKELRIKFLNDSFKFLNDNFPKWKNNIYFKKEPFIKRIIKTNKLLIKLYWLISN